MTPVPKDQGKSGESPAASEKNKPASTPAAAQQHQPAPAAQHPHTPATPSEASAKPAGEHAPAVSEKRPPPAPVEEPEEHGEKKPAPKNTPKNPALESGNYVIEVYRWNVLDGSKEAIGTILSQSLQKLDTGYAGHISMRQMRGLTPKMSSFARLEKFCRTDGMLVHDEAISLDEYLALSDEMEVKEEASAKKDDKGPTEEKTEKQDNKDAPENPSGKPDEKTEKKDDKSEKKDKVEKPPPQVMKPSIPRLEVLYRSTRSSGHAAKVADAAKAEAPALNMQFSAMPSGSDLQTIAAPTKGESMIDQDATLGPNTTGNTNVITPGTLTEEDWAVVLRNCSVMYGWKVDPATQQIVRAPRPAFRLRLADSTSTLAAFVPETNKKPSSDDSEDESEDEEKAEKERRIVVNLAAASLRGFETAPKGIPNFRTNDDSRIEITACSTALAMSLAKSDFSSQSTEASANGGFGGYSVAVSVGVASSESKSSKEESSKFEQMLVARYMYPRCDLFLRPEDLEPTPELAELLRKVKEMRSLDALRQIQTQFGSLFSQELTLGGRLLSTKTTSTSTKASVQQQKEQFKVSVGVSVQTPYGGASVKHESETGKEETSGITTTESKEGAVFEASGGDTILANNPTVWAATVASPALWRVINRDNLAAIVDMLSEMPGYEASQMWFVQAMPALSKYIRLNAALSTNVRFKVEAPTNSLACHNDGTASFYLGCKPNTTVTPRLMSRSGKLETYWLRFNDVETTDTKVLFNPSSYRAPTIYGFKNWQVGGAPFGSEYNPDFAAVQWELVSPYSADMKTGTPYELKNGAKVILRTVPFRDSKLKVDSATAPAPAPAPATTTPTTLPGQVPPVATPPPPAIPAPQCHMIMFRNTQGVFLPAISDSDEYQYWRIEKTDTSAHGAPIKGGDSIRLSWCFEDQSTGMRDFVEDVFGRRRAHPPPGFEKAKFYIKVPWPRLEVKDRPTTLVMSTQSSRSDTQEVWNTLPGRHQYRLQDLVLRIDTVDNKTKGDCNDYMLRGIIQENDTRGAEVIQQVMAQAVKDSVKDYGLFTVTTPLDPKAIWQRLESLGAIAAPA